ncbi:hypothetical protein EF808_04430 [archaeon]|nr:MAG: hypothetical protein EF808_04430 [archaeon]
MSVIEDFAIRTLYGDTRDLVEVDLFTASSFGRAQVRASLDVDDLTTVAAPELVGLNVLEQRLFDDVVEEVAEDPNARFAFSLACAKAAASYIGLPLYQYLGGVFNVSTPSIVYGDSEVDTAFNVVAPAPRIDYSELATLSSLSTQVPLTGGLQYVEEGSWHVACGLSYRYVEIYKKEDINELLRIKEHMTEV